MKSIVVYATDENYVKLTAVSMYSLLMHNSGIDVAIFTDHISSQSASLLTGIAKRFNSIIKLIDANQELGELQSQNIPGYTSYSVYSRYIAAKKLSKEYDRFLQVDSDTNKRKPKFPVITRESRRILSKTTWFSRHRKMRPLPATAFQKMSQVPS